jgi:hypothetical protein
MTAIPQPEGPDIVEFAMSEEYLGKGYLSTAQRAILKSIYDLPMERDERLAFLEMTEGREPRKGGYDEAAIVAGVRSGKSDSIGGVIMTYECVRWTPMLHMFLPPGKTAKGIIIAQNDKGANEIREYVEGNLLRLEEKYGNILARTTGQERSITGKGIRLQGADGVRCEIVIYPSRKASVRGSTGLCFVGDEVAYWEAAEGAYNQDEKVIRAVRSRFATLSPLRPRRILISSPDEEEGVLYEAWRRRFERPRVLVCHAPSWVLHPKLNDPDPETGERFLDNEQEEDPESFETEYGAQFRKGGGGSHSFLPAQTIDNCVERGRQQNPPKAGVEYLAWMDAAFKRDRFSMGIGHAVYGADGEVSVSVDRMRHWTPRAVAKGRPADPLDDREVLAEVVAELRPYGLDRIHGDQFADVPIKNHLSELGILFVEAPVSAPEKVDAFKNLRAALRAKLVSLPDDPIMVKDLKSLVMKETPGGHTSVSAARRKGSYDDAANVVARIVTKLLPKSAGLDIAKMNFGGRLDDGRHGRDWTDRNQDRGDLELPLGEIDGAFGDVSGMVM